MLLRPRWGAGRMMHPPGRLLYITNSRFLCLGASRATDTVMHNPLGTASWRRRSGGQSELYVLLCREDTYRTPGG
eukprot:3045934-Prymnesium_polylepis.1